jgi:hypothetical protein
VGYGGRAVQKQKARANTLKNQKNLIFPRWVFLKSCTRKYAKLYRGKIYFIFFFWYSRFDQKMQRRFKRGLQLSRPTRAALEALSRPSTLEPCTGRPNLILTLWRLRESAAEEIALPSREGTAGMATRSTFFDPKTNIPPTTRTTTVTAAMASIVVLQLTREAARLRGSCSGIWPPPSLPSHSISAATAATAAAAAASSRTSS